MMATTANLLQFQQFPPNSYITDRRFRLKDVRRVPNYKSRNPMTMQKSFRVYVGTVARGTAGGGRRGWILRSPGSDVALKIPGRARGVHIGLVHTDLTKVRKIIPDNECIIAPPVEFHHLNKNESNAPVWYEIRIPHCLPDTASWNDVVVRKSNTFNKGSPFQEVPRKSKSTIGEMYYEIDKYFIRIFTTHFCHFTCTVCNYSCSASAMVFLAGSLERSTVYSTTMMEVKAFLCSKLFSITDFSRALVDVCKKYNLKLLKEKNIGIENNDPIKSKITLTIAAAKPGGGEQEWEPENPNSRLWIKDERCFRLTKNLSRVMDMEGCHACRPTYPSDAMLVQMENRAGLSEFKGSFELVTTADPGPGQGARLRDQHTESVEFSFILREDDKTAQDVTKELTDRDISELSRRISDDQMMNKLGAALRLPDYEIVSCRTNSPDNINHATCRMLQKWFRNTGSGAAAWSELREALIDVGLRRYVGDVLESRAP